MPSTGTLYSGLVEARVTDTVVVVLAGRSCVAAHARRGEIAQRDTPGEFRIGSPALRRNEREIADRSRKRKLCAAVGINFQGNCFDHGRFLCAFIRALVDCQERGILQNDIGGGGVLVPLAVRTTST